MAGAATKTIYHNFDGIRGVAAIAVVLFHCSTRAGWAQIVPHGYLAVDLFFGLSGFVIAQAYGKKLRGGMSFRDFAVIRLIRLYPMHLLGLVLGAGYFVTLWLRGGEPAVDPASIAVALAVALFFLPVPATLAGRTDVLPINGPVWSLFFELAVNALYAIILPLITRARLVVIVLASGLVLIATAAWAGSLHVGWAADNLIGGVPRVMFSFWLGVLLYELRPATRHGTGASLAVIAATIALLSIAVAGWAYDALVVIVAFPVLLYWGAAVQPGERVARVFRALGDTSYPLYILHMPVLLWTGRTAGFLHLDGMARHALFVVAAIALIAVSYALSRTLDPTVRRALAGLLGVRPEGSPARLRARSGPS